MFVTANSSSLAHLDKLTQMAKSSKNAPSSFPALSRQCFIQRFSLRPPSPYDPQALLRARRAIKRRHQSMPRFAAVMIPLVERQGELYVLLTKRASHLRHHAGQISFPGGKVESGDKDMFATAAREMHEEIGIRGSRKNLLGSLAPLPSVSGYLVTPVIVFIDPNDKPSLDRNEVEQLFEVPISPLLRRNGILKHTINIGNQNNNIYAATHDGHLIWGLTAQILHALLQQVHQN